MKKYTKPEMNVIEIENIDIISTSEIDVEQDAPETLITKGGMVQNFNSEDVGLFR